MSNVPLPNTPQKPVFNYDQSRADLSSIPATIQQTLNLVQLIRPLITVDYLRKEGLTDLSKIDGTQIVKLGEALLADYRTFSVEAKSICDHLNDYLTRADFIWKNRVNPLDETGMEGVFMEGVVISEKYNHWYVCFISTFVPLANDLIQVINAARPLDHQIQPIQINMEPTANV